ncbi:DNA-processing protein DprA [Microbacterium sp. APC 3901]|uniref:DNA-processing protein DprA n=1 Tax=Microbacterium sp. APC 3901 TaxID=3035192 RepID=UPI0025B4A047|nr:DNA-processing protein DprA [Microbacterium sp. APC 3901]MDN3444498.1 DNA-processing protein DprA [Microbacterium sp. APC 3901]
MIDSLTDDAGLRESLDQVRPSEDAGEALARVCWSVLAEPGDGVAGALIGELGALGALRFALGTGNAASSEVGNRALADGRARWKTRADVRSVGDAVRGARDVGARLLIPGDTHWPISLDDLGAHAPAVLWVRGDPGLLSAAPRVAIVGARAASGYGEMLAGDFAGELAGGGAVVVSGGAYGIDGAAHRAALGVGGSTIAFLAGGVDRAYPQGHQQLLRRIVETGAVVSEVPCGTAPTKWRFLSRNRLIAAVSDATVVVEAGWRSGSLNTAGHAAALGRPLGAVPGPVTSASSAGCHRLLREYDARCVTTTAEIRELWGGGLIGTSPGPGADPDRSRVLDAMSGRGARAALELSRRSGLAPERVIALLGLLELEGEVVRVEGGWQRARLGQRRG